MTTTDDTTDIPPCSAAPGSMRLRKAERLRSRTAVLRLFDKGKSVYAFPLRMIYISHTPQEMAEMYRGQTPADMGLRQMLITVPKKKFRHAVDRVWLRRRIREAYRLNRDALVPATLPADAYIQMAFIYVGDKKVGYDVIEKKMRKLLGSIGAAPKAAPEGKNTAAPEDKNKEKD